MKLTIETKQKPYIFTFGKFKGEHITNVYTGYINWIIEFSSDLSLIDICKKEKERRSTVSYDKKEKQTKQEQMKNEIRDNKIQPQGNKSHINPSQSHKQNTNFKKSTVFEFTEPLIGKNGKLEKYPYIFQNDSDYFKAEKISDRIKDMLQFEMKIDLVNDYYLKDKEIPYINRQKCKHPFKMYDQIILSFDDENMNEDDFKRNFNNISIDTKQNNSKFTNQIKTIDYDNTPTLDISEFEKIKTKSDKIKIKLKENGIDWYDDIYKKNKTVNNKYHVVNIINSATNLPELTFIDKTYKKQVA